LRNSAYEDGGNEEFIAFAKDEEGGVLMLKKQGEASADFIRETVTKENIRCNTLTTRVE
jgi:hypothetical protein